MGLLLPPPYGAGLDFAAPPLASVMGADTDRDVGLSPVFVVVGTAGCFGVVPLVLDRSEEAFWFCLCADESVEVDAIKSSYPLLSCEFGVGTEAR